MLEAGIKGRQEVMVTDENSAAAVGSGLLPVFATPAMVALMEKTAWMSVAPYLNDGEGTVGTKLENDAGFVHKLEEVYAQFKAYMAAKEHMSGNGVAYFSMEYGLHTSLKIYSGGLGILAGDYLKEASDKGTKITAVGLLYRYGYFTQKLSAMGDQEAEYEAQDFMKIAVTPVRDKEGNWETISLVFPGRNVYARIWRVDVGRIELYLLDTDFEDNLPEDRSITTICMAEIGKTA